jgi:hypothetical protein
VPWTGGEMVCHDRRNHNLNLETNFITLGVKFYMNFYWLKLDLARLIFKGPP